MKDGKMGKGPWITRFVLLVATVSAVLAGTLLSGCPGYVFRTLGGRPDWSPDGSVIAFESRRDGRSEIYIMNSDLTHIRKLTSRPPNQFKGNGAPKWSPKGDKIVYHFGYTPAPGPSIFSIYIMNSDGSNQIRLSEGEKDADPAWSPDGSKIVFRSWREGLSDIYVMNTDGTNQTRLTTGPEPVETPRWSPDGQRIAFFAKWDKEDDIWIIDSDGSNPTNLTADFEGNCGNPNWSPDGTKIAFDAVLGGNFDIFTVDVRDRSISRITGTPAYETQPAWSPDGRKLAVAIRSENAVDTQIALIDVNGK